MSDDAFTPGETLHLVRSASFDWVNALAERLQAVEIPHEVRSADGRRATDAQWGVYVRERDLERAAEIDREVMREVMPDLPEDFDPAALDAAACPACAEPVGENAAECPSCGLALL